MEQKEIVELICRAAADKKANEIIVLDMPEGGVADKFIICSGQSKPQVKAICDKIDEELVKANQKIIREDGYNEARWVVMDLGDLLVHVFCDEDRLFYNLERLWNDGTNAHLFTYEL